MSGDSILIAAEKNSIPIPILCYHPDLKPHGACRLCLVENEKTGRLMASCVTPAAQDMVIQTASPRVLHHRRNIVRLMMAEHPESCIVCSKGNHCELRRIAASLGVGDSGLYPMPNFPSYEQMNPFIIRDLSKCILCGKCIRADHELVVAGAIEYNHRGFKSRPATLYERPLEESICTFCGTCVSICPTGALSVKNTAYVGTPDQETDSICGFCSVGCSLSMGVAGQKVVDVNPSKSRASVNGATLCVRGHFANDYLNSPARLTRPLVRSKDGEGKSIHAPAAWDEALDAVVMKLSAIKREFGAGSVAFIGSSKCSNEENYLFQKIAREIFETPNLVTLSYDTGQALAARIDARTGGMCRVNPLAELEGARVIVVVNADPGRSVPVVDYHIRRAAKKGAALILVNPWKIELNRWAGAWMRPDYSRPSGPMASDFLLALAKGLVADAGYDRGSVEQATDGFDAFYDMISRRNGIAGEAVDAAVRLMKNQKIAFVIGADTLCYPDGAQTADAVANLLILTGGIGAKRSGLFVLLPESNTLGAMDMGMMPDHLPGRVRLDDGGNIGPDMEGFIEGIESGRIRAAYIMGENPARSLPQPDRVAAALKKLDLLVVQDILYTRTAAMAHFILPGAAAAEKAGAFTNLEGRIQMFSPVVQPPGEAKADWEILAQLIWKMGHPEHYQSLEKIRQEIRRLVPMYQGLGSHLQGWIANNPKGGKPAFAMDFPPVSVALDAAHPFIARLSAPRHHLGGGTRTGRSERVRAYGDHGAVEISPDDCRVLGLEVCGKVRLVSEFGKIERSYVQSSRPPKGMAIVPMGENQNDAMGLAGLSGKNRPASFGWTVSRVGIEKI